MNKVLLTGNLTNDFLKRSEKLATCGIAVKKDFGSGVEFIEVVAFGDMVKIVGDLKKGTSVFIEGSWSSSKSPNGDKKFVQVVINKIEVFGLPKKVEQLDNSEVIDDEKTDESAGDFVQDDLPDDDLPF